MKNKNIIYWILGIILLFFIIQGKFEFPFFALVPPTDFGYWGSPGNTVISVTSQIWGTAPTPFIGYEIIYQNQMITDEVYCYLKVTNPAGAIVYENGSTTTTYCAPATCSCPYNYNDGYLNIPQPPPYDPTGYSWPTTIESLVRVNNNFVIDIIDGYYFQGAETNYVNVSISSTYPWDLGANLSVALGAQTGITGVAVEYQDYSKYITIKGNGITTESIYLDPSLAIGEYTLFASLSRRELLYLNAPTYQEAILVPTYTSERFLINPKPTYVVVSVGNPCPEGYEKQIVCNGECTTSDTVCIRSDLRDLSCYQLGCPVTVDYTYSCSSSGMCIEVLFTAKNCTTHTDCDSGFKCEPKSGVCIDEVIYNNIMQCSTVSDCMVPCDGITIDCVNLECVYSGTCAPIIEQVNVTCVDIGCPANYTCTDGLCQKETITTEYVNVTEYVNITTNITEQAEPTPTTMKGWYEWLASKIGVSTTFLFLLITGIIVYYLFATRRLKIKKGGK